MADLTDMAQAISRHSEAGQQERQEPPRPKQVSFSDIPAQAWKKDSPYHDVVANKFNPAVDTINEAVSGAMGPGKKSPKSARASAGNKSGPAPTAFKSSKDAPPEEKKRLALIKQVNLYLSNQLIVNRLAKKGVRMPSLPSNVSLADAEEVMEQINEALSGDFSKSLVLRTMVGVNALTETMVPILKKQHVKDVGLSEEFMKATANPDSDLALSMEELSIMLRPFLPIAGALTRFAYSYGNMCTTIALYKTQQQQAATGGDQEYYEDETPVEEGDEIPN